MQTKDYNNIFDFIQATQNQEKITFLKMELKNYRANELTKYYVRKLPPERQASYIQQIIEPYEAQLKANILLLGSVILSTREEVNCKHNNLYL